METPFEWSGDEIIPKAPETCRRWKSHSEASTSGSAKVQVHQLLRELQLLNGKVSLKISQYDQSFFGTRSLYFGHTVWPNFTHDKIHMLLSEDAEKVLGHETCHDARMKVFASIGAFHRDSTSLTFDRHMLLGLSQTWPWPWHRHDNYRECKYKFIFHELEALLWPVQSSSVLEELWLQNQDVFTTGESWVVLANIIRSVKTIHTFLACEAEIKVPELALIAEAVLEGAYPSPLRKLDLRRNGIFNDTGAEFLMKIVRSAPNLIELGVGPFVDVVGAKNIGHAVAFHQSLETLFLQAEHVSYKKESFVTDTGNSCSQILQLPSYCTEEINPTDYFLTAAFGGMDRNISIRNLFICHGDDSLEFFSEEVSVFRLGVLPQILAEDSHISQLIIAIHEGNSDVWFNLPCGDWQNLFKYLQMNSCIEHLQLIGHIDLCEQGRLGLDTVAFAYLVDFLKSNRSVINLTLSITPTRGEEIGMSGFNWPAFWTALSSNSTIKTLDLQVGYVDVTHNAQEEFCHWIRKTTSLECLTLGGLHSVAWTAVFKALRENTSLLQLNNDHKTSEFIDPEGFRELMAMLQVNSTLNEVTLIELDGHQRAMVREALRSKARQETYLAELRRGLAQTQWMSPRCGRLFLCGAELAGKTRLALTMLNVSKERSLRKRVRDKFMRRTEGVEIHTLRNDESKQILIWDLAGQDIFRAMQEFLFPKLNRACIFVFVFSPVHQVNNQVQVKSLLEVAFEKELRTWLRFIASNSAVTGFNLPEVMVVVSHKDKAEYIDAHWADHIVQRLGTEFSDVIHIHTTPYFVDCRQTTHVQQLVDQVYSAFDEAFREKVFRVPASCFEMSRIILEWKLQHKFRPIIQYDEFFALCDKSSDLQDLKTTACQEKDRLNVLRAVASYLHDVGTIVEFPQSNFIVVDPNWLTHEFLGSLLCIQHGFQRLSATRKMWAGISENLVDGFVYRTAFHQFLQQQFLKPLHRKGFTGINLETLETLLKSLGLCYEVSQGESSARFFVPIMFKAESDEKLEWHHNSFPQCPTSRYTDDILYYGLRVRCKDRQRTYLSSGFFSRFQIMIWPKLVKQLSLRETQIECKLNLISLMVDGHDILVENDEEGKFIDIMVRSIKSPTAIWDFVSEFLLTELMDFCVSSRGSPGVELVVDILRMECVRNLTLRSHRKDQSVSREDLQKKLKESIERQGGSPREKDLYHHTWTAVPEANLHKAQEAALDLLLPADIQAIEKWVESRAKVLAERKVRLAKVVSEFEAQEQGCSMHIHSLPEEKQSGLERGRQCEDAGVDIILSRIDEVHLDVKRVLAEVKKVKSDILHVIRLQHKIQDISAEFARKLEGLVGVSDSSEEFPKWPYFTNKDVGFIHRVTAFVMIGKPLVLHFTCENNDRNHIVDNQPGLQLTVEEENREVLRMISTNAVRVMWYLLKAGLHIGAGIGNALPDLSVEMSDGSCTSLGLLSMSQLLAMVEVQDDSTSVSHHDITYAQDAWSYLQDYLRPRLQNQVPKYFRLHRARYLDKNSTHAWLCEKCLRSGVKHKKIIKL